MSEPLNKDGAIYFKPPNNLASNCQDSDRSVDLYTATIRYVEQATRLQIELNVAQDDLERWRRVQLSHQYSQAGQATRAILDQQQRKYTQVVSSTKERLEYFLTLLSALPDLATQSKILSDELDGSELASYICKLDEWVHSARLISEGRSDNRTDLADDDPRACQWTWNQIKVSVYLLDMLSQGLTEKLYLQYFTNISSDGKDMNTKDVGVGGDNQEVELMKSISTALKEKLARGKTNLEMLNAELKEVKMVQKQTREYLQQCEQRQTKDHKLIQELTKQLEHIKTLPRPLTTVPEGLIHAMQRFVSDKLETDVVSSLGHLIFSTWGQMKG